MSRAALPLLGLLAICVGSSCADERTEDPADPAVRLPSRFTLRGAWEHPEAITYRVDSEDGPPDTDLEGAVADARDAWNALSPARLVPLDAQVEPGRPPDLLVSWKRGEHGPCPLFGTDPSVAHAGPVEVGTYLHLDADRPWDASGGPSLRTTLLHELGHVLGLGHSADPGALLARDPLVQEPGRADRDALWTLYGGGELDSADLVVARGETLLAVLHGVAPAELVDFQLFDTDGNGRDEVVVWRTDAPRLGVASGEGEMLVFHFAAGPTPHRTVGPFHRIALHDASLHLVRAPIAGRLLLQAAEGGATLAYAFDENGHPAPWSGPVPDVPDAPERRREGDLDGDGVVERVERAPEEAWGRLDARR